VPSLIRNPKDFWSGLIFVFFGVAAVVIARDYPMGTAGRMGPAYFPTILGAILAVIGAIAMLRSLLRPGEAIGKFALKEVFLVLLATVLFGVLLRGAGLAIAIIVLVLVSGYASTKFRFVPFLAVAIGMAVFSVLLFIRGLGLPMPIIGPWFAWFGI
jgi:hypothetical protein